jgi:hypothetical protein
MTTDYFPFDIFYLWLLITFQLENDQITEDERLIKQYKEDTEKKRDQIEELKTT